MLAQPRKFDFEDDKQESSFKDFFVENGKIVKFQCESPFICEKPKNVSNLLANYCKMQDNEVQPIHITRSELITKLEQQVQNADELTIYIVESKH